MSEQVKGKIIDNFSTKTINSIIKGKQQSICEICAKKNRKKESFSLSSIENIIIKRLNTSSSRIKIISFPVHWRTWEQILYQNSTSRRSAKVSNTLPIKIAKIYQYLKSEIYWAD